MNKVELSMGIASQYRIEANTFVSGQPDNRKGNVDTLRGNKIEWTAQPGLNVMQYVVTFKRLDNGAATWPFKENADGQGQAPPGYTGPLVITPGNLTPGNVITLTTKKSDPPVKYDVTAVRADGATVDHLDPVIIIRPGLRSIVAEGLPWAAAGAVAGAVITWLLLNGQ